MRFAIFAAGAILFSANLSAATVYPPYFPLGDRKIKLVEFDIDASDTEIAAHARCSEQEVLNGQTQSFRDRARNLVPSYDPQTENAVWPIDNEDCPSLKPHLSGIGFDSYDKATGNAVLYVAAFNFTNSSELEWAVFNVYKFPAKCAMDYRGIAGRLGFRNWNLNCTLDNGKGSAKFVVPADRN